MNTRRYNHRFLLDASCILFTQLLDRGAQKAAGCCVHASLVIFDVAYSLEHCQTD